MMKPKKPPFRVITGTPGEEPPPFVAGVSAGRILLGGARGGILDGVERAGLAAAVHRDLASRFFLPFTDHSGPYEDNEEVRLLMFRLNTAGFKFAYDPKVPGDPSGIMSALQEHGQLNVSYDQIAWIGPGKWQITTYEMTDE
jgi:hypothetical protein